MSRVIHVALSAEARDAIRGQNRRLNRAGRSLRDWLVHFFETAAPARMAQVSLFSEPIEVGDDVPLLLATVSHITARPADELVEAWALEESSVGTGAKMDSTEESTWLPGDVRNRAAELLDLAETLFEETISDVEQRFGGYPQGKQAGGSAAEIYRALRSLLKIGDEK
jgi:hypothetical protein